MIIFSQKSIHRWSYWRTKSKLFFCFSSGALYAILSFSFRMLLEIITGFDENSLDVCMGIALGSFIGSSFLSIAFWYENERRFRHSKELPTESTTNKQLTFHDR